MLSNNDRLATNRVGANISVGCEIRREWQYRYTFETVVLTSVLVPVLVQNPSPGPADYCPSNSATAAEQQHLLRVV